VELLAQLNPIMKEHLRRIQDKKTHQHYLDLGGGEEHTKLNHLDFE
jgi:hypothetical protein